MHNGIGQMPTFVAINPIRFIFVHLLFHTIGFWPAMGLFALIALAVWVRFGGRGNRRRRGGW